MITSQVITNPLGWASFDKQSKVAKMLPTMSSLSGNKRQRVSKTGEYQNWNMNMFVEGDENKNLNSNLSNQAPPNWQVQKSQKRPHATMMFDGMGMDYKSIKQAALSLLNLSAAKGLYEPFPRPGKSAALKERKLQSLKAKKVERVSGPEEKVENKKNVLSDKSSKSEEDLDENNTLDSELYRRRAQELLFQNSDILLGERKDAFFELVKRLCPYINIVRSGSRTLRTYLVDTRKKKRYRTYSDAIKGGALDPLLVQTGTTVLLRGCVDEARKRFNLLSKEDQMYINTVS